jgi:hypothetical protein
MDTHKEFLQSLMVLPRKPEYVGFGINPDEVYQMMLKELNKIVGWDMRDYTTWELHDEDFQFQFYILEYDLSESLTEDEYEELQNKLPFGIEDYWDATAYLGKKAFDVSTWVYVQGRPHDMHMVDVQIGVPKAL